LASQEKYLMLRSAVDLLEYTIKASDGVIGHIKDLYFDDKAWVIRYLVVDTGSWLSSRKVLISPIALGRPDRQAKELPASISKAQVKDSPNIDTEKPVSRQHELQYFAYYGYPYYWDGAGLWGEGSYPGPSLSGFGYSSADAERRAKQAGYARAGADKQDGDDPHLRSCKVVRGYHIQASDGDIGHVESLIVDEETWAIRYLIVEASNWWIGHKVLIAPPWIGEVSWEKSTVSVNLTRDAIRHSPPYDPGMLLDREQETGIHAHYGHNGYWVSEAERETDGVGR
jgi:hypothetical protein